MSAMRDFDDLGWGTWLRISPDRRKRNLMAHIRERAAQFADTVDSHGCENAPEADEMFEDALDLLFPDDGRSRRA
jgi:hypothetical protein